MELRKNNSRQRISKIIGGIAWFFVLKSFVVGSKIALRSSNQKRAKGKQIVIGSQTFSRALHRLQISTVRFDKITSLSASAVIGQNYSFSFRFEALKQRNRPCLTRESTRVGLLTNETGKGMFYRQKARPILNSRTAKGTVPNVKQHMVTAHVMTSYIKDAEREL